MNIVWKVKKTLGTYKKMSRTKHKPNQLRNCAWGGFRPAEVRICGQKPSNPSFRG